MNRQIKFRGLRHLENGKTEWVYGFYVECWNNKRCIAQYTPNERTDEKDCYEDHWDIFVDVYEDSIGQFTGLKDKNGAEIYEGDIFTVKGKYPRVILWDKVSWAAMPCDHYHDKKWWVMNLQHPGNDWWEDFSDEIEVIGNIYDNPIEE